MHIVLGIRLPEILQQDLIRRFQGHEITIVSLNDITENILETVDVIVCGGRKFSVDFLKKAKNLKLIQVPWIGVNDFNFVDIKNHGILLANSKWNPLLVAEFTLSLVLSGLKQQVKADRVFRQGKWESRLYTSKLLSNSNVLLIGYGDIGTQLARLIQPFKCNVTVIKNYPANVNEEQRSYVNNIVTWDQYNKIIGEMDVIIVSLPLTDATSGILSGEKMRQMKNGSYFVNVGRGGTVDEQTLYEMLKDNHLGGASIDVWYQYNRHGAEEPFYPSKYPFHELDNVIMSPHRASTILDSPENIWDDLEFNLKALEKGTKLKNLIDLDDHY